MRLIVMDDSKKNNNQICELAQRKKHQVVSCSTTNEFMESLDRTPVDKIIMNVESWQHGNSIYKYFGVARKLSPIPVIFYNAPETFVNIAGRDKNEGDRVLTAPAEPQDIIAAME